LNNIDRNLSQNLSSHNFFFDFLYLNCFFYYLLYWFLDLNEHIIHSLYLFYDLLDNWHMNYSLDLYDFLPYHLLLNNFLHYLRHLYYFLNYTRYYNYFLYYFLDLNYLRYLNHFLYYFLYNYRHFFDPVYNRRHLYYFLLDIFNHFRHLDIHINVFLDFNNNRLLDYKRLLNYNFFDMD
jgi:hypothetical protein